MKRSISLFLCLCLLTGLFSGLRVSAEQGYEVVTVTKEISALQQRADALFAQIEGLPATGGERNGRVRLSGFSQSADGSTDMKGLRGKYYLIRNQDNAFYALDGSWTGTNDNLPLRKVTPSDTTNFYYISSGISTAMAFSFHYAGLASNGMPGYVLRFSNGRNLGIGTQYTNYTNLYYVKGDTTTDLAKAPKIRFEHPDGSGWARIRNFDGTHGLRQSSDLTCVRWKDNSAGDNAYDGNALYLYRLWSTAALRTAIGQMQAYLKTADAYEESVYTEFLNSMEQSIAAFQSYNPNPTAMIQPYDFIQETLDERTADLLAFASKLIPVTTGTVEQLTAAVRVKVESLPASGSQRNGRVRLSDFSQSADGSKDMKDLRGTYYIARGQDGSFYALDGSWTGTNDNLPLKTVTVNDASSQLYITGGINPNMAFSLHYAGLASNGMPGYVLRFSNGRNMGIGTQYTNYTNLYYVKGDTTADLAKAPKIRFEHPNGSGWVRIRNFDGTHGLRQNTALTCMRWKDNSAGDNAYDGNAVYLYRLWSTTGLRTAISDMMGYLDTPEFYDEATYRAFLACMEESIGMFQTYNADPTALIAPYDFIQETLDAQEAELRGFAKRLLQDVTDPSAASLNTTTKIHQLPSVCVRAEGDYSHNMSYIIQTRSGKIILIDGGWEADNADGKYLFAYLQKITGDATPHVDAWFITHAHGDHHGAVSTFANLYANQVTVDAFYHHYPTEAELTKYLPNETMSGVQRVPMQMKKLRNKNGGPVQEVYVNSRHSGKCNSSFDFDEVHIDILLDFNDVMWAADNVSGTFSGTWPVEGRNFKNLTLKQLVAGNFNETSIVFRASVGGKNVLFTGDAGYVAGYMLNKYHDAHASNSNNYYSIQSDFVQVAHHGYYGVTKATYNRIDPDVGLWPTPKYEYTGTKTELALPYALEWFAEMGVTNYPSYLGPQGFEFAVARSSGAISIPAELRPYVFDAEYYSEKYEDLAQLYGTDERQLYYHFVNYGIEEGRCASPFFDVKYYAGQNTQHMTDTFRGDYTKAFADFLSKYRSTTLLKLSEQFDAKVYAENHKDLAAQGYTTNFDLLKHYANNGYQTGEWASKSHISADGTTYHNNCTFTGGVAATCTTAGQAAGVKCASCGLVLSDGKTIPALGHREVVDAAVAATCTTSGLTEGKHCSVCNEVLLAQVTVPATDHSYDEGRITAESSCTEDGIRTYTCNFCGHEKTEAVAAKGHTVVTVPGTPATCVNSGTTDHVYCSACNTILQAAEVLPRLGHSYSYTDLGNGRHEGVCARCDKTTTASHSFTDGSCICGAREILTDESIRIYHTLDLASDISITFAVQKSALANYDSYYLECVLPEYDATGLPTTSTIRIEPVDKGSYYYFTLTGITAVRMGDMVDAVLHMTKGTQEYISMTDSYSVATYAYATLEKSTDVKMLTLCADLLRYGAEAQSYKKYRTDALVDAAMTDVHRSYLSNADALTFTATDSFLGDLSNPTITWVGKTLDLGSKVGLKFVFNTKNYSGDIENLSMKVSYAGSNGETKTVTLMGAEAYGSSGSYYSFTFYGLLASELRTIVDVAIFDGITQLSETIRYSAESYASKASTGDLAPLCKALFAYSDSAKAYFAK